MKNTFIDSNDRLFMEVQPYIGKYSVKRADFFYQVANIQKKKMKKEWKYRPINAEIEITSKCNQSCPHCGMSSNGMNGISYSVKKLSNLVEELSENAVTSISVTGGEPFVEFENMLDLINASKGKVDICKITTNGFWGYNPEKYFSEMEKAGLFENRFFVPCLMVSIGEQSTPMEHVCNIFHYALERYSSKEITLCISSLSEYGKESKVDEFVSTYENRYGKLPENRIFLTSNYYRNADCMDKKAVDVTGKYVENYMQGPVRCFEHTIGKYVLPRMLIKTDGEVRTCACFNPPDELKIGNVFKMSITEILEEINNNVYVSIIASGGLHNFKNFLDAKEYEGVTCTNECDACRILINKYNMIKKNQ